MSVERRTGNILLSSMNEVFNFLRFTLELGEDFEDGMLPTLDTLDTGHRPLYKIGKTNRKIWKEKCLKRNNWFQEKDMTERNGNHQHPVRESKKNDRYQRAGESRKSSILCTQY